MKRTHGKGSSRGRKKMAIEFESDDDYSPLATDDDDYSSSFPKVSIPKVKMAIEYDDDDDDYSSSFPKVSVPKVKMASKSDEDDDDYSSSFPRIKRAFFLSDDDDDYSPSFPKEGTRRFVGKNEVVSTNRGKQPTEEINVVALSEMAAMMHHGPSHDEEEVGSSLSLINVEGYLVTKEIAPLLKKILGKYKDIAKECMIKEKESHVPSLEVICRTCQKLGATSLKDVNDKELKGLLLVVEGIQHTGFDVKWLTERLEDICKLKRLLDLRTVIKDANTKQDLQDEKIRMLKQQIDMLKQQLAAEEADSTSKKMANDKARDDLVQGTKNLTPKGFQHWSNDLLYGLI